MGHFRSRHIRAKYEKLKKKQLDLAKQQRKNNFRKKNWLLANAIVDIDVGRENFDPTTGKDIFYYPRFFSALNTHPFFDATVKFQRLDLWFDRIQLFMNKNEKFFVEKKVSDGVVFFSSSISLLFTEILNLFTDPISVFFKELSSSQYKFSHRHKGAYVVIAPQSGEFLPFSSLVSFIVENNFFISQNASILLLGFFHNYNFYCIHVLIEFLKFYRSLFLVQLENADSEVFKQDIFIILNEVIDVMSRKDLETSKEFIAPSLVKQYEGQDLVLLEKSFLKQNILKNQKIGCSVEISKRTNTKRNVYLINLLAGHFTPIFNDCFFFSHSFLT
jgi:hypothetical protein